MFKSGLIYENKGNPNPQEIINIIHNRKEMMTAKNIIIVKENKYYYLIKNNDNLRIGISEIEMDILINGFRKEKIDFDKIEKIYFVEGKFENSQISNMDEIKEKYGLNDLIRKF